MHYRLFLPLLLLFAIGNLFAQPQAPITWGQFRTISNGFQTGEYGFITPLAVKGDTIVETASWQGNYLHFGLVRITGNNGLTWSPWHFLNDTSNHNYISSTERPSPAITSNGILVANTTHTLPPKFGFFRSTDLGQTWQRPNTNNAHFFCVHSWVGDTIIFGDSDYQGPIDTASWMNSSNLISQSWLRFFSGLPNITEEYTSFSGNHQWLFGLCGFCNAGPYGPNHVAFQRMSYTGQTSGPYHTFMDSLAFSVGFRTEFDDDGNGVLAVLTDTVPPIPSYMAVTRFVSHDNGNTWSTPVTMTPNLSAGGSLEPALVKHFQHRWAIEWLDTDRTVNPQQYHVVDKVAFSPNRGNFWYPPMETTLGDSSVIVHYNEALDIGLNYIRCYGIYRNSVGSFFYQKEGVIHPDSILPIIDSAITFPTSLTADSSLSVSVNSTDNDSIWNVLLVVKRVGQLDSLVDTLHHDTLNHYTSRFTAPRDSGEYSYYYFAEDLWENRGYFPDSARTNPPHFWVGPVTAVKEVPQIPTFPFIKIYPNPGNATFTIIGSLPQNRQSATLTIYNLEGREVFHSPIHQPVTGNRNFRYVWLGRDNFGITVASGIYWCRVGTLPPMKIAVIR